MLNFEIYKADVERACREFSLTRLDLVGSAARADFADQSDIDLLVTFDGDKSLFDRYFGLKERLEAIFKRPIDLIEERAVRNPYIRTAFQRDRIKLYEA